MSLEALITQYGYWALLLGTFLEGETILVIAGFLAFRGYLELPWVITVAFIGTYMGDQFFFYLGRYKGKAYLSRRPHWQVRADRALRLLNRHEIPLVLGFRFLYGIRSVTPFVIGSSGFSPLRFAILDAIGGLIWANVVGILGYVFGKSVSVVIEDIQDYEVWIFAALGGLGLLAWLVHHCRSARLRRRLPKP